jgi:hypothetical protein
VQWALHDVYRLIFSTPVIYSRKMLIGSAHEEEEEEEKYKVLKTVEKWAT